MVAYRVCTCVDDPQPKEPVEIKWADLSRFEGMKLVEIAVSNFGYIYARFEEPDA